MSSLTSALRIATSGMQASQLGLGTVAHNVTNANTAGYTRQIVQTGNTSYNGFGAGVKINQVQRITDTFLNTRVLNQVSELDYATTRTGFLDTVEGAFTSSSVDGSLDAIVNGMFASFNQLANDPDNSALKRNAVQQMGLVVDTVRDINQDMDDISGRVNVQITEELDQVNTILKRLHDLNLEIATQSLSTSNGANVNDLVDERDRQVDELAKRFKLDILANGASGAIRITTESGQKLLDEGSYVQFERTSGTPYQGIGFRNVQVDGTLSSYANTLNVAGLTTGRIRSLLDIRDTTIPNIVAQMDEFAETFKNQLNTIASQGTTFPPQRNLYSYNTGGVTSAAADLVTELHPNIASTTFNLSVVDSQGNVINTTVGNGGPIDFGTPTPATLSLNDIVAAINNNADVGNTALGAGGVTASIITDINGAPVLRLQATNSNARVIVSGVSGDFPGIMGFNNLFTGNDSSTLAIRSDILSDPSLLPTARMRADGGVSSLSNENILKLAQVADTRFTFSAAGGMASVNATPAGYIGEITGSLAIVLQDAKSREQYAEALHNQLQELKGSVSGVNMNEELSLMLTYQQGFQASARIVTVVDSLMEELMNTVR